MWCDALNALWEWVSSHCLFHPTITNQVGPGPKSQSLCSQYEALLKPPTKQNNCLSHLPSRIEVNLVTRLNPSGVNCSWSWQWALPAWVRADQRNRSRLNVPFWDPHCCTGTLSFRMLGRAIGANWKPGQGGGVSYKSNSLYPLLNQKHSRVKR